MRHDLLDAHREPDDPEQHREMPEAVRVTYPDPDIPGRGVLELLLESFLEPAEVRPPQEAGNQERKRGIGGQGDGPLVGRDGRACDDQRLAEGDDHEQRVSLGEVAHMDVPRAPAGRLGREQVRQDCQHPDQRSDRGICERAHEDEREPDRRHARPAPDPGCPKVVGSLHLDEDLEGQTEDPHDEVGDRKQEGVVEERLRHPGGHHERRRGGGQRGHPNDDMGRVGRVERPGELGPRPPDHPEQDEGAEHPVRREVLRGERRDLGHGEHEDEVEEELDERDALRFRCVQSRRSLGSHRPHCSGSDRTSAGLERQQDLVARAAARLAHLDRSDAARIELVLLDVGVKRREVPCLEHVVERPERDIDVLAQ